MGPSSSTVTLPSATIQRGDSMTSNRTRSSTISDRSSFTKRRGRHRPMSGNSTLICISWLVLWTISCNVVKATYSNSFRSVPSFVTKKKTTGLTNGITSSCQGWDDVPNSSLLMKIRGGGGELDSDDEEDYDDDELEDDEDEYLVEEEEYDDDESDDEAMFDSFELGDDVDDDFAEANLLQRMIQAYHKTPPLTKGYLTASFAATAVGYLMNTKEFPSFFLLEWKPVLTQFQIWRPITAFLNFGGFGLGYVMTIHFVWTYMSTIERLHHHKPYDFWIMMIFGMVSMLVGYPIMKQNAKFLGHNFSTYLVYVWSRYHEGLEVNLFELFNTKAELLPWFFLAQTFLLEGELPTLDFLGIVFGHIYYHLKTVGMLRAPPRLVTWYTESPSPSARGIRDLYKKISTEFEA